MASRKSRKSRKSKMNSTDEALVVIAVVAALAAIGYAIYHFTRNTPPDPAKTTTCAKFQCKSDSQLVQPVRTCDDNKCTQAKCCVFPPTPPTPTCANYNNYNKCGPFQNLNKKRKCSSRPCTPDECCESQKKLEMVSTFIRLSAKQIEIYANPNPSSRPAVDKCSSFNLCDADGTCEFLGAAEKLIGSSDCVQEIYNNIIKINNDRKSSSKTFTEIKVYITTELATPLAAELTKACKPHTIKAENLYAVVAPLINLINSTTKTTVKDIVKSMGEALLSLLAKCEI